MPVSSYHHLVAPLVACGALLLIILICRWVFSTSERDRRATQRTPPTAVARRADYGLLVPVATAKTAADAEMLRAVLREAGIRCTVSADGDGADVLVFRGDALRARDLVSSR